MLGYFLAHVCNDLGANKPWREDSTAAAAREPPWACGWSGTKGDVPPEHNDLPRSDIPIPAIHGQMDPCCGPRWSEQIARTMPNVQAIVMQGLGHSPVNECRSQVIQALLSAPDAKLDKSCANEVHLDAWVLEQVRSSRFGLRASGGLAPLSAFAARSSAPANPPRARWPKARDS